MVKIALISCVRKKLNHRARAEDIYNSPLFKMSMNYARSLNPDEIYILSAKYGLLDLEKKIEPYNCTLNKMPKRKREKWAEKVVGQLEEVADIQKDEFIFLASQKYREYIIHSVKNYSVPMAGLSIGRQLRFLKINS